MQRHQGVRFPSSVEGSISFLLETPERWVIQTKKYFGGFFGDFEEQKNMRKKLEEQTKIASEYMAYAQSFRGSYPGP